MPSVGRRAGRSGVRPGPLGRLSRAARFAAWLLSYLLLAHLILGGVAAGAIAAQASGLPGADAFCSAHAQAAPDSPADSGHAVHCLLCPLAGATPLLPGPVGEVGPPPSPGIAATGAQRTLPFAPARVVHEHARPRAPPASAIA